MLAGRPPFRGGSLPELLQYHRFSDPPRVSRFAADVPDELDQIILRLLSKDPQARATSAMVVAKQLSAMEHALSLPHSRIAAVADEDESPDDAQPRQPTDGTDHLNVTSAEPGGAGPHDDFSINLARTLADPNQDPEATDAGSQVVGRSAEDEITVREAPSRPESTSPMAAGAPLGAKSARGPSAHSAIDQLTLSGDISKGALAHDELPRIAPAAPISR